jgi:hypothetical protein
MHSSSGKVFGARVLYGAIVALSAAILFTAVASTMPQGPARQSAASAAHTVETVVVTTPHGEVS